MKQSILSLTMLVMCICNTLAFSPVSSRNIATVNSIRTTAIRMAEESESSSETTEKKQSLEEKMAGWEASDEEIKAASLGGMTPGKGTDGFDIGLYLAFPVIVATSLFFAVFPFIMDKIDVSSVGPPPTV
uniref:Uncharacterized protein n=1 Tax=Chaetoceros debilis TaxID=122233 RepID=A0A7S3PWY4_9STRA|mmetsp:Transcript_11687/g.17080  ORF Transcript_11687/g.17080 Transcript_11687/m.17080 type:complete len:130 (+) Transcript_11687:81-470(+)